MGQWAPMEPFSPDFLTTTRLGPRGLGHRLVKVSKLEEEEGVYSPSPLGGFLAFARGDRADGGIRGPLPPLLPTQFCFDPPRSFSVHQEIPAGKALPPMDCVAGLLGLHSPHYPFTFANPSPSPGPPALRVPLAGLFPTAAAPAP